jgi:hypothetical protein
MRELRSALNFSDWQAQSKSFSEMSASGSYGPEKKRST